MGEDKPVRCRECGATVPTSYSLTTHWVLNHRAKLNKIQRWAEDQSTNPTVNVATDTRTMRRISDMFDDPGA